MSNVRCVITVGVPFKDWQEHYRKGSSHLGPFDDHIFTFPLRVKTLGNRHNF